MAQKRKHGLALLPHVEDGRIDLWRVAEIVGLLATLLVLGGQTCLLRESVDQQTKATKLLLTPNLGAKWELAEAPAAGMQFGLLATNYSDFPLYVRNVRFDFSKGTGFSDVVHKGAWHLPPKGTDRLATLYVPMKAWEHADTGARWPVRIAVSTSTGMVWEVVFWNIGLDELEFVSIKEMGKLPTFTTGTADTASLPR